jgi:glycine hydroxymethyltransferase
MNSVVKYIKETGVENLDNGFLAYLSSLEKVSEVAPEIASSIVKELDAQRSNLKLIASENYCSLSTQLAMGNLLTDKYAEGFPYHRFYAGCDNIDDIEAYAAEQACTLFGAEHAYVQPHSGADANMIAYWAILNTKIEVPEVEKMGLKSTAKMSREDFDILREKLGNQRLMGLDYYSGGHLTHGYRFNVSAQMFDAYSYTVNKETGLLDYDELEAMAEEVKPLILLAGYSAYPRLINFKRMKEIADKVGAVLMVDMAHFAGLVAAGVFKGEYNPIEYADVVTTTTHKTLRGPRGGMVLCKEEYIDAVNKGCPLVIGGPLPHVMAAKGIAFKEANTQDYKDYGSQIVENSQALAQACIDEGMTIATGGTDNHLFLIDVTGFGLNGRQAESVLRECGITLNRNALPFDVNGPWYTSGLRIGTPAVTTLGMNKTDMKEIAAILKIVLESTEPAIIEKGDNAGKKSKAKYVISDEAKAEASARVKALLDKYPVYPELDLEFMKAEFVK